MPMYKNSLILSVKAALCRPETGGWMAGIDDGWMDGWMDGRMDGRVDGWTDGRMDGWMDTLHITLSRISKWFQSSFKHSGEPLAALSIFGFGNTPRSYYTQLQTC